jgi:hypothetical protein
VAILVNLSSGPPFTAAGVIPDGPLAPGFSMFLFGDSVGFGQATLEVPPLLIGEREGLLLALISDAVPQLLDQLEPLGDRELQELLA